MACMARMLTGVLFRLTRELLRLTSVLFRLNGMGLMTCWLALCQDPSFFFFFLLLGI